jgi:hypothetical protein
MANGTGRITRPLALAARAALSVLAFFISQPLICVEWNFSYTAPLDGAKAASRSRERKDHG